MREPWNHNIHYHPQILKAIPHDAERALDFPRYPFEPASYDVVASVATLHHVDARAGLLRMRELVRPGGALVVVGLARTTPRDLLYSLAAVTAAYTHRAVKGHWEHPSPIVWPPPVTFHQMRALAADLLPGSTYRRHLLFRYSITWRK